MRIALMANAYSPHVRHWRYALARNGIEPVLLTIHDGEPGGRGNGEVRYLGWRGGWLPPALHYVLAGLWVRWWMRASDKPAFVHAHNTSGYGLMAYVSGLPYVITTYGSEIFQAGARGRLYRAVIRRILHRAVQVTGTTEAMAQALQRDFSLPVERIRIFSLGLVGPFAYSAQARQQTRQELGLDDDSAPLFFANRRVHPHYNTLELVRAFRSVWRQAPRGMLLLLEGDSDRAYLAAVEAEIGTCAGIRIVRGFIDQQSLSNYLCAADFIVSIPKSDQLSSSLLEAARCMTVPVLSDLPAYAELLRLPGCGKLAGFSEAAIADLLSRMMAMDADAVRAAKQGFADHCASVYPTDIVDGHIRALYQDVFGLPEF